ncbi:MAG: tyrosine-type recombinase/integrase [Lachnospiraceae bacterium]|nr:tyrosine-type recombinase/integrase [Lachnospiraceae bacterium]
MQTDTGWIEAFLSAPEKSMHTKKAYQKELRDLYSYAKKREVQSAQDMRASFFEKLSEDLPTIRASRSAAARFVSAVHSYFSFLQETGRIPTNAADFLSIPSVYPKPKTPEILTKAEIESLLTAPQGDSMTARRDRAILTLLYAAGLRASEVISTRVEDADLQAGMIQVKGRLIPFDRETRKALVAWLLTRKELTADPEGPLFLSRAGKPLSRQSVWNIIRKYAKEAGLTDKGNARTLRRSLTFHLMRQGAEEETVKELLGLKSTAAYAGYRNREKERMRKAQKKARKA